MNRLMKWMLFLGLAGTLLIACGPSLNPTPVNPEHDATVIASLQTDLPNLFTDKKTTVEETATTVFTPELKESQAPLVAVSSATKPAFPTISIEKTATIMEVTASPESTLPKVVSLENKEKTSTTTPVPTESSATQETNVAETSHSPETEPLISKQPLEVEISPINATVNMPTLALVEITPLATVSPSPTYNEGGITSLQFNSPDFSQTVEKSLSIGAVDSYSFLAEEDQYLSCKLITVEKGIGLSLYNRYGNDLFATIDTAGSPLIKIPATGWYRLEVKGGKAAANYRLELSLPIVISLSKELPSLHMTENLAAGESWRLGSEIEAGKLLRIKLNSEPAASFKLTVRDLINDSVESVEGLKIIEWIFPKGFGNRFMIELENIGENTVVDLILEQLPSIQV
jgi:hypothetical protein